MEKEIKISEMIKKVKKKVRVKKEGPCNWELMWETKNDNIDLLFDIYRKDKKKSKIIYLDKGKGSFSKLKCIKYEEVNGDFAFVIYRKIVGISKNNRIYTSENRTQSIVYKGNKFYFINGSTIRPFMYNYLASFLNLSFINETGGDTKIKDYLINRFSWVRFISENNKELGFVTFNRVISKKLYNYNDLISDIYGTNLPLSKKLIKHPRYSNKMEWLLLKEVLTTEEGISDKFLDNEYLFDLTYLSRALTNKINPRWSEKRIKSEHDRMSDEQTDVLLEFQPLVVLKIGDIFEKFSEFSGFDLIRTNHELFREGKKMQHCVASYSDNIERGFSGIYRLDGYTLELTFRKDLLFGDDLGNKTNVLSINQCRGFKNSLPTLEYYEVLIGVLFDFSKTIKDNSIEVKLSNYEIKGLRDERDKRDKTTSIVNNLYEIINQPI